jgi:CDP-diglyceride synthetase
MTCTALALSLVAVVDLLFNHVEKPGERVHVKNAAEVAQPIVPESVPSTDDAPPASLLLQGTPLASAHCFYSVLVHVFGLWYAGWLFSHGVLVLRHPSSPGAAAAGISRVVYLIVTTAGGENGGMVLGSLCGRTKLTPRISPNKSREGAMAQVLVSGVVSAIFAATVDIGLGPVEAAFLGLALGVVGTMGDLFESFLKRSIGVKDAGRIIPGAGGMLDRMDGLIFNFPFLYYYLEYAHKA